MGYYYMVIISSDIRREIQLKFDKVIRNPEVYDQRKLLVEEDLLSLGDLYSFWIENPDLREALLLKNVNPQTVRKIAERGVRAVRDGWYFLTQKGKHGTFVKELNTDILQRLNGIVEPRGLESGRFRRKDVTLGLSDYTPVSWERVPERVNVVLQAVRQLYTTDPVEAAILAHLGFAAIQPFVDGNKRTARLTQNRILYDAQFPPVTIPAGEGKFYFGLLKKALPAFRDKNPDGQKQFFDYCASKINNGLDEILGDLNATSNIL